MADGISEMHGIRAALRLSNSGWDTQQDVEVVEYVGVVGLKLSTSSYPAGLTPAQARYLARKLYRIARRVEGQVP